MFGASLKSRCGERELPACGVDAPETEESDIKDFRRPFKEPRRSPFFEWRLVAGPSFGEPWTCSTGGRIGADSMSELGDTRTKSVDRKPGT